MSESKNGIVKELATTLLVLISVLAGLALFCAATMGVLNYFDDGPLWQLIAGFVVILSLGTFWVYMRTHHWN